MRFISDNVKTCVFQSEFNILFQRTYRFSGCYIGYIGLQAVIRHGNPKGLLCGQSCRSVFMLR